MEYLVIVSLLAVVEFVAFGMLVGMARGRFGVPAPAVSGNEEFERRFRVHYNTLEQLVVFLPGLWAFGIYVSAMWAALLGLVFLVGRIIYAVTYIRDPATRGPGMLLSVIPSWVLLLGGIVGVGWQLLGSAT